MLFLSLPPRVTPGQWKEGGTIFASMCMFQKEDLSTCFTVMTDQHDVNLMHRQAGYRDVLWENALLVPCQIPQRSLDPIWYLKVSIHEIIIQIEKTLIPSLKHLPGHRSCQLWIKSTLDQYNKVS